MVDRPIRDDSYKIGQTLELYQRVASALEARSDKSHEIRVKVGDKVVEITPDWENENINPGTAAGAILAGISSALDELYVPIGADTEIVDYQDIPEGTKYTINVDSPFKQQARFRAMMEAGTGFTSLVSDRFNIQQTEVKKKRMARDTWQYDIVVIDTDSDEDSRGLGILTD